MRDHARVRDKLRTRADEPMEAANGGLYREGEARLEARCAPI
jgi:hypothetical protein